MTERERMENAYQFATALCYYSDQDMEFRDNFWEALCRDPEIMEEFCYYMDNQKFLCRVTIEGYTIVDVMVWHIDHFTAELDRRDPSMHDNGDKMLLLAFDTFLKMRDDPAKYVYMLQEDAGEDYASE